MVVGSATFAILGYILGFASRDAELVHASFELGPLNGWISGLIAGGGLAITSYQIRQTRISSERMEADRRQANALAVSVDAWQYAGSSTQGSLTARVTNAAELPVYFVNVSVRRGTVLLGSVRVGTVGVGGSASISLPVQLPGVDGKILIESLSVLIRLQDCYGSLWTTLNGKIVEASVAGLGGLQL